MILVHPLPQQIPAIYINTPPTNSWYNPFQQTIPSPHPTSTPPPCSSRLLPSFVSPLCLLFFINLPPMHESIQKTFVSCFSWARRRCAAGPTHPLQLRLGPHSRQDLFHLFCNHVRPRAPQPNSFHFSQFLMRILICSIPLFPQNPPPPHLALVPQHLSHTMRVFRIPWRVPRALFPLTSFAT